MASGIPGVLADPIGVAVDLVSAVEPGLGRAVIEAAVTSAAGSGRAKRRRLAQALAGRPEILTDGRSPAPRAAGELLIALRNAGATVISSPVCAGCGRNLRTLQRRGQDWYCAVCGPRPGRCACCGQQRIITTADRRGQPRCGRCPDRDDRDPLAVLTQTVRQLDPSLPAETITAAACRVFSRPAKLRQLAWAVEDEPGLLTGGGARAPMPGVLRLIDELCDAGAQAVTRPACPRCQRVMLLYRRIDGQWCCRTCVAATRARPCARCGVTREPAARDEHGGPLCPTCLITDPANQEICAKCGRRRPVSTRTPDGPLCPACRPWKMLTCGICGKHAPCLISQATGTPWCRACKQRCARIRVRAGCRWRRAAGWWFRRGRGGPARSGRTGRRGFGRAARSPGSCARTRARDVCRWRTAADRRFRRGRDGPARSVRTWPSAACRPGTMAGRWPGKSGTGRACRRCCRSAPSRGGRPGIPGRPGCGC